MMPWFMVRSNLYDDPDVIALSAKTGLDEYSVVGRLVKFWSWLDKHTEDGRIPFCDSVTSLSRLDSMFEAQGFAQAMIDIGWLDVSDGWVTIPHFDRWNGATAKKRAKDAIRQREHRSLPKEKRDSVTKTSQKKCDKSVTLEKEKEKEKEKYKEEETPYIPPFELSADDQQKSKKQREKRPTHEHGSVQIPEGLMTPGFQSAWGRWIEYRSAINHPYKVRHSEEGQLLWCLKKGPDRATACIEESIRQGWQGVFDPDDKRATNAPKPFKHAARSFD